MCKVKLSYDLHNVFRFFKDLKDCSFNRILNSVQPAKMQSDQNGRGVWNADTNLWRGELLTYWRAPIIVGLVIGFVLFALFLMFLLMLLSLLVGGLLLWHRILRHSECGWWFHRFMCNIDVWIGTSSSSIFFLIRFMIHRWWAHPLSLCDSVACVMRTDRKK